ncbi:hypothetical protein AMS68_000911 [Peltaster fructicola]|uniref:RRM domain-containing protein n=1 Tax=Peltaster fructicola TaxID=286661 RepID=A0A6H0XKY1_9PEZI|nr:hypothetical protein AMS68_000911 [Peltaster fructicola]
MATTVHVKGISYQTTEKEVRDFFSFCGKISSLEVKSERDDSESPKEATVIFEKETAAKTALLLDNTMLGAAEVHVTTSNSGTSSASTSPSTSKAAGNTGDHSDDLAQEDKPRSRIFAEYLANGYILSDKAIESALSLDQQHGISARFNSALQQFDSRTKATENAQAVDQKYGITARAQEGWKGLSSYFEKAIGTPTGQRVRAFYEQGQKQVLDVHNEARHLADLKSGKDHTKDSGKTPSVEQAQMEKVEIDGKQRTHCNCGGADGSCPCEPGKCACSGCGKAGEKAY